MSNLDPIELFIDRVTGVQQGLFAYILSLLSNVDDANDVLQETNMVLWRKRGEYRSDEPFWPWARTIAHYQVLAHAKRKTRDRLRFGEQLISRLAEEASVEELQTIDSEQKALGQCVEELSPVRKQLVELRYNSRLGVSEIARKTDRSPGAVSDALYRIRSQLAECIRIKLSSREGEK